MENIVIYGNGRIAKIIYSFVKDTFKVAAFTVDRHVIAETQLLGKQVIPFDEIEKVYMPDGYKMIVAVGYLEMNKLRERKYLEAKGKGYSFASYMHPSVQRHENVEIGENTIILDHISIQPFAKVGSNNIIWSSVVIGHGCIIEDNCWITSGVVIGGDSVIKSNCFLGLNATIGHNVIVERENFIGANTLVSKSTLEKEVYVSKNGEKSRLDSERFIKFAGV